jgi:transcriptional regulator with XRE-family HTH domain
MATMSSVRLDANALRGELRRRGLSQHDVAVGANVSESGLSRALNGHGGIRASTLRRVATYLGEVEVLPMLERLAP